MKTVVYFTYKIFWGVNMKIIDRLFRLARDKPQNRISGGIFAPAAGITPTGIFMDEQRAIQSTVVYACVRVISEAIASLPLMLYTYLPDGGKSKEIDNPLYGLVHDAPNPEMTSFIFRETMMCHLLLWGNAYAQIIRNGRGQVLALYPLLPSKMEVSRAKNGEIIYTYSFDDEERKKLIGSIILKKDEVLHIPGLSFDGLIGYSPIAAARNAIAMSLVAENYGAAFFANGANPGGVLEHPNVVKDPDRLRASWQNQFSGTGAHRIAVLEEGLKYHQMSIPPEQAQFLQTRKFQINEIARIFRIPPHMIGDLEKSSFSNIEQQSLEFVKYTLDPWVIRWEQALFQTLLSETERKNLFFKFNVDGLLRGDYASRMSGYATARQNGWMSANDIRELENMNRIPAELGGDDYLVNGSFTKLQNAGAFANKGGTDE